MEAATNDISSFKEEDGFSCVISMHDGVVMYTTSSLTSSLGFPKDIWIGRSFMNFIHPKDCNTFASHILGLISPKIVNDMKTKGFCQSNSVTTIFCRIRKYRGLSTCGFGVKDHDVTYIPFLLKFSFKNINEDEGTAIYLVVHATQCCSAYKTPCEAISKAIPFVIRHIANGNFEYLDPESVPYLGYLPQDVNDRCALHLYHPEDMSYLRETYEIILKEGSAPRSRPYRMLAQNGDYIRLETEWSSFINPWSRKLEFVIGKHHVVEGPTNPDVFRPTDLEKGIAPAEDDQINSKLLRENIIRIMNEVLTKPSEVAKQQMSKRCQDLTTFMEKLMEEQKLNEPFKSGTGDRNSYYDRGSVMLGGISPHRDYNDSDSSTGTPLRYNQLNYSENIQRYFHSRESFLEDNPQNPETNMLAIEGSHRTSSKKSTTDNGSGDSGGATSSGESSCINLADSSSTSSYDGFNYVPVRLTESILNKHNTEMEKKLIKKHRETRSFTRGDRDSLAIESKSKKKDYRSNNTHTVEPQLHGVKRNCRHLDELGCSKHQKVSLVRQTWTHNSSTLVPMQVETLNVESIHHVPVMGPVSGMFPMYYVPTHNSVPGSTNETTNHLADNNYSSAVQYMMHPHAVFEPPFVYSPMPPVSFGPVTNTIVREEQANPRYATATPSMGLTWSNYDKVCKSSLPYKCAKPTIWSDWRDKKTKETQPSTSRGEQREGNISSTNALNRSNEAVPGPVISVEVKKSGQRVNRVDEINERTDGESSYSSFYSSLLKTPSQSADDSIDSKKKLNIEVQEQTCELGKPEEQQITSDDKFKDYQICNKKVTKRKMEPPWMEHVSLTTDMIYKYKIDYKSQTEVLSIDKEKMNKFEQPSLVNEQLEQLYLDLQLAGVAAQLTLEEGFTSESSGDENINSAKAPQRNWKFNKLSLLLQEDAPLPLPSDEKLLSPLLNNN